MRNLFLLLSLAFVAFSCNEEFLESTPYAQATSADFWRNGDDALAAANAMYEQLRGGNMYGHTEQTFEICSDDYWRAGDHGEDQAIEEFTFDADNKQLRAGFDDKYEIISRANAVLINVPDINMDASLKDQILGEAYFMRGFALWRLYVIYGTVPIILEQDVIDGNFNKPKSTEAEVRSQIEADWLEAANLLPDASAETTGGRPTKGSAWGFLSKLYIYSDNLDKTIEFGEKIINNAKVTHRHSTKLEARREN